MHGLNRVITLCFSEADFVLMVVRRMDVISRRNYFPNILPCRSPITSNSFAHRRTGMGPALGKRKRRDQIIDVINDQKTTADDNSARLQALCQQHFESTFEPLPGSFARPALVHHVDSKPSDEDLESDWDGFSEHGEEQAETVHHATFAASKVDVSKNELKTFMVRAQITIVHQH